MSQLSYPPSRVLRWLLRLDQALPVRSDAEVEAEARQNYRWNFAFSLLDGAFFWFGISFISSTTILPLFVSKLTDHPLPIALLPILGQASWYLPQLFMAGFTEGLPHKKLMVINVGFFTERLPIWLMPFAALISVQYPQLALVLLLVGYGLHNLGAGVIAPAWSDMIARCFPVERRGWYFGFTSFVGTGLGALGALYSGRLLEGYPFPTNFAYAFLIAALMMVVSWFFLAQVREPLQARPAPSGKRGASWQKIRQIVREDQNFRRFLLVRLLGNFSGMGIGFVTLSAIQRWQVADGVVGIFTLMLLIGQTVGTLLAGIVADRYGHKLVLSGGFGANLIAFSLAWLAPDPIWYYAVFVIMGIAMGMMTISGVLAAMEFAPAANRPSYIGLANTSNGIGVAVAPLVGGLLATVGYSTLFALTALAGLATLLALHWWVIDPRHQAAGVGVPDPALNKAANSGA